MNEDMKPKMIPTQNNVPYAKRGMTPDSKCESPSQPRQTNLPIRVIIFAKAPQPGFAKTRLIAALGAQGAADLARRMLAHTVAQALAAAVGPVELCVSPAVDDPAWQAVLPTLPDGVSWTEQGGGDLGQRMGRAVQRAQGGGAAVLLIGTDCPQLGREQLQCAASALQHADAALLPAFDGGYALLGLTGFDASLFAGIAWSTDSVAAETLRRIARLGWTVESLPMLHDIDEPADLQWLPRSWQEALEMHHV
jgi:rSAM/selenodomain-associated transferase 1